MQTAINSPSDASQTAVRGTAKWSLIVICLLGLLYVGVEGAMRVLVPRISKIEGRTKTEMAALYQPASSAKPLVEILGNSLLLHAIHFDEFTKEVHDVIEPRRFVVEQTSYYDWYYGIKYLFDHGAKPDTVVLVLAPLHLISQDWRGEYTAQLMLEPRDALQLAQQTHMHPTATANMMFADFSYFYGMRGEIRKVLLGRIIPDMPNLTGRLVNVPAKSPPAEVVERISAERLKALNELCKAHGSRFAFMIAPGPAGDGSVSVLRAGAGTGVPVWSPVPSSSFVKADFPDGFHAGPDAAARYTKASIEVIRKKFAR